MRRRVQSLQTDAGKQAADKEEDKKVNLQTGAEMSGETVGES